MPQLTGFPKVPIPGPRPFPVPLANVLRFLADPAGRMLDLHRRFGRIAAVADRSPAVVCAFGAELNRQVLADPALYPNDEEFVFKAPPGSSFARFNASMVLMNGDAHRRARRLVMPAFQKAAVDGYAPAIVATAEAMLSRWPVGETEDVARLVRELTLAVSMRCLFGVDVTDGTEELGRLAVAQLDALASPLTILAPFDLPGTTYRALLRVCERLEDRFRAILADKRRGPPSAGDVVSLLVHARDDDGSALSDDEVIAHMNTLFVAGHETTANTLAWTLFLLSQHPEATARAVDEGAAVLRGGAPAAEHVPRLVFVDHVIRESMRLLPATPMLFLRVAAAEAPLGPYRLPRGANIALSPLVTHRDPELYPEPARFRPERWEGLSPGPYAYLPFGAGPRMCVGAAFAQLALRLVLPMILQRFRLTLAPGARISRASRGISFGPKHGLPMEISRQDGRLAGPSSVRGDIHELCALG